MYSSLNPLPFPPLSFYLPSLSFYYQLLSVLLPSVLWCTLCFFFIFILKSFYPFPNNSSPTPFDYLNLPPYYPLTPTLALLPYLLIVSPFLIFSIETPFFRSFFLAPLFSLHYYSTHYFLFIKSFFYKIWTDRLKILPLSSSFPFFLFLFMHQLIRLGQFWSVARSVPCVKSFQPSVPILENDVYKALHSLFPAKMGNFAKSLFIFTPVVCTLLKFLSPLLPLQIYPSIFLLPL